MTKSSKNRYFNENYQIFFHFWLKIRGKIRKILTILLISTQQSIFQTLLQKQNENPIDCRSQILPKKDLSVPFHLSFSILFITWYIFLCVFKYLKSSLSNIYGGFFLSLSFLLLGFYDVPGRRLWCEFFPSFWFEWDVLKGFRSVFWILIEMVGKLREIPNLKFEQFYFKFEAEILMADSWENKSSIFRWGSKIRKINPTLINHRKPKQKKSLLKKTVRKKDHDQAIFLHNRAP